MQVVFHYAQTNLTGNLTYRFSSGRNLYRSKNSADNGTALELSTLTLGRVGGRA